MSVITITWDDMRTQMRQELWPPLSTGAISAEPKSLRNVQNAYFQEAATDLQSSVPELRVNNTEIIAFGSSFFECGLSLVAQPVGQIQQVFTILDVKGETEHDWCSKVWYAPRSYSEVLAWTKNYLLTNPEISEGAIYSNGVRHADVSADSTCGRARSGFWSLHNKWLYLTPWIQSNEKIVILWDGIKDRWANSDVLDSEWWGTQVREAIKYFVMWKHELFWGCKENAPIWEREYNNKRADIMHDYSFRSRPKWDDDEELNRLPTAAELVLEEDTVTVVEATSNAVVELGGTQVTITWVAPGVTFTPADAWYTIERDGVEIAEVTGAILTYTDTSVVGGQSYTYAVFLHY